LRITDSNLAEVMPRDRLLPKSYDELLGQIKDRIHSARLPASLAVIHEAIVLYWQIGRDIRTRQEHAGWDQGRWTRIPGGGRSVAGAA
jgi:hypothetical protein